MRVERKERKGLERQADSTLIKRAAVKPKVKTDNFVLLSLRFAWCYETASTRLIPGTSLIKARSTPARRVI